MAEQPQRRIKAVARHLQPDAASPSSPKVPSIRTVAPGSSAARVQGKVAIITGANSPMGIGRATAYQFAESGARALFLCDLDDSHLESHRRELVSAFPAVDVHIKQLDAADGAQVQALVDEALRCYGRLDVFFANAGTGGQVASFTDIDDDHFMSVMKTNTLSVFLAAKHATPAMMKTTAEKTQPGGSIIGTASVAGLRANAGTSHYSASKAAVISLAQTIAFQLAGSGIRINVICPGLIETGMTAWLYEAARSHGKEHKIGQLNPLKRGGHADEVARVALFLGSDESSYVNGQAWTVDGGLSAGHPYVPIMTLLSPLISVHHPPR